MDTEASSTIGKLVLEPYKPFSLAVDDVVLYETRITVITEYVSFPVSPSLFTVGSLLFPFLLCFIFSVTKQSFSSTEGNGGHF